MAKAFDITSTRGLPALNISCPGISQSCRGRFQIPDESLPHAEQTTRYESFAVQDELRYTGFTPMKRSDVIDDPKPKAEVLPVGTSPTLFRKQLGSMGSSTSSRRTWAETGDLEP